MKNLRPFLLPALAIGSLAFGLIHVLKAQQTAPAQEPPAPPPRSAFGRSIAAAGLVEARSENIAIGSALSGVVIELFVTPEQVGKRVKKGEPLFRVDDRHLQAQLALHQANVQAAEAQVRKLETMPRPEEIPPSQAKVNASEANLKMLEDQFERAKSLLAQRSMSVEEFVQKKQAFHVAGQQLAQSQADLALLKAGAWEPDLAISRAGLAQAKAQLDQTQTEIDRTLVRAPMDADVLQVNVRLGEYVGATPGTAHFILGDRQTLHVRIDVDEHDLPRYRSGANAQAQPRGGFGRTIPLRFVRVEPMVIPKKSLTGDNAERIDTRVLPVIYALDASAPDIFVGQQLEVFIDADSR